MIVINMDAIDPSGQVPWFMALLPIIALASAAMAQPAGRLLSVCARDSTWLRASPIFYATDVLGMAVRLVGYSLRLSISPKQALLIVASERLTDDNGDPLACIAPRSPYPVSRSGRVSWWLKSVFLAVGTSHFVGRTLRLVSGLMFFVGFRLSPGSQDARWSAAWALMFLAACPILEILVQANYFATVRRHAQQPVAVAVEMAQVAASPPAPTPPTCPANTAVDTDSPWSIHSGSTDSTLQGDKAPDSIPSLDITLAPRHDALPGPFAQVTIPPPVVPDAPHVAIAASHPHYRAAKATFDEIDTYLLYVVASALHMGLINWAFLDLVQPPLNRHVLAVDGRGSDTPWKIRTSWATALMYISVPFVLLGFCIAFVIVSGTIALTLLAIWGAIFVVARSLPGSDKPINFAQCYRNARTRWAFVIVSSAVVTFIVICMGLVYIDDGVFLWACKALTIDLPVLFFFYGAGFLVYVALRFFVNRFPRTRSAVASTAPAGDGDDGLVHTREPCLSEVGCAIVSVMLVSAVVVVVWYALRFPDSDHWAKTWDESLVYQWPPGKSRPNETVAGDDVTPVRF